LHHLHFWALPTTRNGLRDVYTSGIDESLLNTPNIVPPPRFSGRPFGKKLRHLSELVGNRDIRRRKCAAIAGSKTTTRAGEGTSHRKTTNLDTQTAPVTGICGPHRKRSGPPRPLGLISGIVLAARHGKNQRWVFQPMAEIDGERTDID